MNTVKLIVDLIFDVALFVNAVIYVPQVLKVIRLKEARELSFITFFGICLLQLSMALHGYVHQDYGLMIGMLAAFLVSLVLTFLLVKYRKESCSSKQLFSK